MDDITSLLLNAEAEDIASNSRGGGSTITVAATVVRAAVEAVAWLERGHGKVSGNWLGSSEWTWKKVLSMRFSHPLAVSHSVLLRHSPLKFWKFYVFMYFVVLGCSVEDGIFRRGGLARPAAASCRGEQATKPGRRFGDRERTECGREAHGFGL